MSNMNNPNLVRTPLYELGTKVIKTDSGIEYCVEYITEDKKLTRLLWVKESGSYIRLNANVACEEEATEAAASALQLSGPSPDQIKTLTFI